MRDELLRERNYVIGFVIYTTICGILYFSYLYLTDNIKYRACPVGEYILSFEESEEVTVNLWSYLTVWAISNYLPKWRPYAPITVLQLFSYIYDNNSIHLKDFNELSLECQQYGGKYHAGKFKVLNIANEPQKYADLVFFLKEKIREQFIFSKEIEQEVTIFVRNELEKKSFERVLIKELAMIVVNRAAKHDRNLTNFYIEQVQALKTRYPLFFVLGDTTIFKGVTEQAERIIDAYDFSVAHSLFFASKCQHLIIDGSAESTLFTLFNQHYIYIYKAEEPLKSLTEDLETWHHYP